MWRSAGASVALLEVLREIMADSVKMITGLIGVTLHLRVTTVMTIQEVANMRSITSLMLMKTIMFPSMRRTIVNRALSTAVFAHTLIMMATIKFLTVTLFSGIRMVPMADAGTIMAR